MRFLSDLSAPQINLSPFTVIAIRVANLRRVKALIPTREKYPLASPFLHKPLDTWWKGHCSHYIGSSMPLAWNFNPQINLSLLTTTEITAADLSDKGLAVSWRPGEQDATVASTSRSVRMWILYRPLQQTATTVIRYDTRCYFNVHSKADISQLNLPNGTDN